MPPTRSGPSISHRAPLHPTGLHCGPLWSPPPPSVFSYFNSSYEAWSCPLPQPSCIPHSLHHFQEHYEVPPPPSPSMDPAPPFFSPPPPITPIRALLAQSSLFPSAAHCVPSASETEPGAPHHTVHPRGAPRLCVSTHGSPRPLCSLRGGCWGSPGGGQGLGVLCRGSMGT